MEFSALIADDNEDYQIIIKSTLEFAGYSTEIVENGAIALERLRQQPYYALFLDLNMPIMSGNAVLQTVRRIPGCEQMYVVVVTANSQNVNGPEVEHADFVMMKPVKVEELARFAERIKGVRRKDDFNQDSIPSIV